VTLFVSCKRLVFRRQDDGIPCFPVLQTHLRIRSEHRGPIRREMAGRARVPGSSTRFRTRPATGIQTKRGKVFSQRSILELAQPRPPEAKPVHAKLSEAKPAGASSPALEALSVEEATTLLLEIVSKNASLHPEGMILAKLGGEFRKSLPPGKGIPKMKFTKLVELVPPAYDQMRERRVWAGFP
jgi:hypothetical protein